MSVRCVVIGASGYTGAELVKILCAHPGAEVVGVFGSAGRDGSESVSDLHPSLRGLCDLDVRPLDGAGSVDSIGEMSPDAVFLATPHEASVELAPKLLALGAPVFDLSGGFRLNAADYPAWYGFEHGQPELLGAAAYGLVELNRERIAATQLVAVAGCYPTAATLGLAPVIDSGLADLTRSVIVDAVSGVSGAGRGAQQKTLFCEVSLSPYGVLKHRHEPEIRKNLSKRSAVDVVFTPHLGPFKRGILATMHVALENGVESVDVAAALTRAYDKEAFVRVLPFGQWPSVGAVEGTNFCDVQCAVDEGRGHAVIVSAIDNLVKGAAGQAVQCMNVRLGLEETAGLLPGGALEGAPA